MRYISTFKHLNISTFQPVNYEVRMEGLEPPHLAASDPKSDVSTNFTTSGGKLLAFGYWLLAFRLEIDSINMKLFSTPGNSQTLIAKSQQLS